MILQGTLLYSQGGPALPQLSGENLHLFCDRDFYCVTEDIYFSAFYSLDKNTGLTEWSMVLYVELIKWNGEKISKLKVPINDGLATGSLTIPEDIKSGNYYLRSYTKWMRNYSPYMYQYIPLKIINPSSGDIDNSVEMDTIDAPTFASEEQLITDKIILKNLQYSYACREEVKFSLGINDELFTGKFNISIAKNLDSLSKSCTYEFKSDENNFGSSDEIRFLPELKTMTMEGSVLNGTTNASVSGEAVVLSSTIDPFYLFITSTDKNGRFIFPIPATWGQHQFCLQSLYETIDDNVFLINSDYCTRQVSLPYIPFQLSTVEELRAKKIVQNAQLHRKFSSLDSVPDSAGSDSFYGTANKTIIIEEFIELKDLKEFFFELVPEVMIGDKNKESYLIMESTSNFSLSPPLILVDNIPVPNGEEFLNIPSKNIDRIEIMDGRYIVNDFLFSGLISVYSNNRDIGGMELNGDRHFFNYHLFDSSDIETEVKSEPGEVRTADMRNLLYFNPEIQLNGEEPVQLSFHTSDAKGVFTVTLRGVSEKGGSYLFDQFEFVVE